MESSAVLNWWTEYCSGLYNNELHSNAGLFQSNQTSIQEAESLPVLREEVEVAVRSLKAGKAAGVDDIPFELLKNGDEATTTVMTAIYQKIWETRERPRNGHNRSSYLYQTKAISNNFSIIVPSA